MIIMLMVFYIAAFLVEVAGVGLVVADIAADQKETKRAYYAGETADQLRGIQYGESFTFGGLVGAQTARDHERLGIVEGFVYTRIEANYRNRWLGVGLILCGAVLGLVGNLISTIA